MLRLTEVELKIFDARQVGYSFCDMNDKESNIAATGLIFKISVICGCQLPTNDTHINILESEFLNFINEYGYEKLTMEEILVAFKMNASGKLGERIETYGALFNLDYVGKVLNQYLDKRSHLDGKLIEKDRTIQANIILDQEEKNRRLKVKEQFKKYLEDENAELDLTNCYFQLNYDNAFYDKNYYEQFLTYQEKRTAFNHRTNKLEFYGNNLDVKFNAGKKAVILLFKAMKHSKKFEIYSEDLKLLYPGCVLPEQIEPKEETIESKDLPF